MRKSFLLLLSLSLPAATLRAQTMVGSWKTISQVVVNEDGSAKDLQKMQTRHWPCMADLLTIFETDGKQRIKTPANCKTPIDYDKMPASSWKMTGNTLTITNKDMPGPLGTTATYMVAFAGNDVTLTHTYTAAEKQKLPYSSKAKAVVITYRRQ